ncbi:MAG: toxin-antitoxin system HicB family antitoxin [Oscillospiraceae bacterium]|nr:toxin-antitoxin system HicB family antitoxin [Oscillospiraceae bacterium]
MSENNKDVYTVEEYMAMPYKKIITSTGEEGDTAFFAEVLELVGCCVDGTTPDEAYKALEEEMAIHLQLYLNKNIAPPLPKSIKKKNVKVLVRMPADLQQKLAITAGIENISINQLIIDKLSSV